MADAQSNQSSQQQQGSPPSGDGSNAASPPANQQANQQQNNQAAAVAAPVRPEAFADKAFDAYFDPKDGVKFADLAKDFSSLRAEKAQNDLRRAGVPAKPDDYKLALPQTFELPKGPDGKPVEFQFDDADPRLPAARAWAHKFGLDQAGFSELLGIQVQADLADQQLIASGRAKEIEKLGVNGPARIDAVGTWLKSTLGSDKGQALLDRLVLADDIAAMEDLVKKFSTQGGGSFSQQHREGRTTELSEEDYQKLSMPERVAHTRRVQSQANGHAR